MKMLSKVAELIDRVLSVPIPESAAKPTEGAIYRVVKGDGVSAKPSILSHRAP